MAATDNEVNDVVPDEVMGVQPTVCIGTIGHVAHGKTTIVRALSWEDTKRHEEEVKKNKTIHLGYANAKLYRLKNSDPPLYVSYPGDHPNNGYNDELELLRHVSFIDCPGHEDLMTTMLSGTAIMDAAVLLVAANEDFPQAQTRSHISAVSALGLKHVIILQNKIDVVKPETAKQQREQIVARFGSYINQSCPILPISAQRAVMARREAASEVAGKKGGKKMLGHAGTAGNIHFVIEYLSHIPVPRRNLKGPLRFTSIRSFDNNKPGKESLRNLKGGTTGGTVTQGVLRVGQKVELRPGEEIVKDGKVVACRPFVTEVRSLMSERTSLEMAYPGGLIAIGTSLDPSLTRDNRLVGYAMGDLNSLPDVYNELIVKLTFIMEGIDSSKVRKEYTTTTLLRLTVGPRVVTGKFAKDITRGNLPEVATLILSKAVCCSVGDMLTMGEESGNTVVAYAKIMGGSKVNILDD